MKQEKKDRKQVLAIVLLISLFLNFSLLAFLIDTRHTWQQEQERPTFQYGTYVDDLSGSTTRKLFAIESGKEHTFYYYTECPRKVMAQGTCQFLTGGEGVLHEQSGAVCGYVIPMAGGDAELVWMKGEIVRVHHYDKAAILPSVS